MVYFTLSYLILLFLPIFDASTYTKKLNFIALHEKSLSKILTQTMEESKLNYLNNQSSNIEKKIPILFEICFCHVIGQSCEGLHLHTFRHDWNETLNFLKVNIENKTIIGERFTYIGTLDQILLTENDDQDYNFTIGFFKSNYHFQKDDDEVYWVVKIGFTMNTRTNQIVPIENILECLIIIEKFSIKSMIHEVKANPFSTRENHLSLLQDNIKNIFRTEDMHATQPRTPQEYIDTIDENVTQIRKLFDQEFDNFHYKRKIRCTLLLIRKKQQISLSNNIMFFIFKLSGINAANVLEIIIHHDLMNSKIPTVPFDVLFESVTYFYNENVEPLERSKSSDDPIEIDPELLFDISEILTGSSNIFSPGKKSVGSFSTLSPNLLNFDEINDEALIGEDNQNLFFNFQTGLEDFDFDYCTEILQNDKIEEEKQKKVNRIDKALKKKRLNHGHTFHQANKKTNKLLGSLEKHKSC